MSKPKHLAAASAVLGALAISTAAPAGATTASYYLRAQVIPAEYITVGSALAGGNTGTKAGFALSANGISGNWATSANGSVHFVVLTFSSHAETGTVVFRVLGPNNKTVYNYSFGSEQVPAGADWFGVTAQGNFSAPGLYFAEWLFNNNLDGWAPLNFSA
jgi:hypothetical protein